MSGYKYLPDAAAQVAGGQGWNSESIIMHLSNFVDGLGKSDELAAYFSDMAALENESADDDLLDEEELAQASREIRRARSQDARRHQPPEA